MKIDGVSMSRTKAGLAIAQHPDPGGLSMHLSHEHQHVLLGSKRRGNDWGDEPGHRKCSVLNQ